MSTLRTTLRRLAAPVLLALAAIPFAGCGGGGYYAPVGGTLEVRNSPISFWGLDAVEVSQPFGPTDHFNVYLAPGERDFIDLIPDTYDVDLLWADGSVDSFSAIDVYGYSTTVLTGVN
jgi:hypothetical protein